MKLMCPSMMCSSKWDCIKDEVEELDKAGIDIFHMDIMDGELLPNFTLGINDLKAVRKHTAKRIDVHLMMKNPLNKVQWFIDAGADIIYIHPESETFVIKTLQHIQDQGRFSGIAISPDWSIDMVRELLAFCDFVLVMTVNPGFAGQKYIDTMTKKVEKLVKLKEEYGYKVMIDGGCSEEVIKRLSAVGADGFVLGTSVLFNKTEDYATIIKRLKEETK